MRDHPPTRQRLWLLILVLGLIVVGAIALVSLLAARLSPTRASVPAEVARHWLAGIPCAPPCWEGITPGQTTLPEALRILKANPAIDPTSVLTDEYPLVDPPTGSIRWNWTSGTRGGDASYKLGEAELVVDTIYPNLNAPFTLDEVISRYGPPTHVAASGGYGEEGQGPLYELAIFYNNYGFWVGPVDGDRHKPQLSPQTTFDKVSFNALPQPESRWEQPWRGFQSFDAYCVNDRTLQGPCPGEPGIYPGHLWLAVDLALGIWVICGLASLQGHGPLYQPMRPRTLGALLALSLLAGLGTCYAMFN